MFSALSVILTSFFTLTQAMWCFNYLLPCVYSVIAVLSVGHHNILYAQQATEFLIACAQWRVRKRVFEKTFELNSNNKKVVFSKTK